jgi:hypothetical protein
VESFTDHQSASAARKSRGGELRATPSRPVGAGYEVRLDGVVLGRHPSVTVADRQARKHAGATIHVV